MIQSNQLKAMKGGAHMRNDYSSLLACIGERAVRRSIDDIKRMEQVQRELTESRRSYTLKKKDSETVIDSIRSRMWNTKQ